MRLELKEPRICFYLSLATELRLLYRQFRILTGLARTGAQDTGLTRTGVVNLNTLYLKR